MLTGDSPDVSGQLCLALQALQDRPVLFKYVVINCNKSLTVNSLHVGQNTRSVFQRMFF